MATLKAVIVEPDGTRRVTDIENDLASFQAVVSGYIEPVSGRVATVYVNEEGLIRNLPLNPAATLFAQRFLGASVVLHGTALIVGPPDDEGVDTDVRQSVVDYYTVEA